MPMLEAFSISFILIKLYYTKLWAIKPRLWPWIEFFSGGQESWPSFFHSATTFQDSQESSPAPQFENINSLTLSFLYSPTLTSYIYCKKHIALTRWSFVGKLMSQLFNMRSRFIIAFLLRSKHLFNSWLQSLSTVILEPKNIKSVTVSILSLSICHEVMGPDWRRNSWGLDPILGLFMLIMLSHLSNGLWTLCLVPMETTIEG